MNETQNPARNHVHAGLERSVNRVEGMSLRRILRVPCSVFLTFIEPVFARASLRRGDFASNVEFSDDSFHYLRKITVIISVDYIIGFNFIFNLI